MKRFLPFVLSMLAILAVGCNQETRESPPNETEAEGERKPDPEPQKPPEPVTLTLYMQANFPIQHLIAEEVGKKYPHITIRPILREPGQMPQDLLAAGRTLLLIPIEFAEYKRFSPAY